MVDMMVQPVSFDGHTHTSVTAHSHTLPCMERGSLEAPFKYQV